MEGLGMIGTGARNARAGIGVAKAGVKDLVFDPLEGRFPGVNQRLKRGAMWGAASLVPLGLAGGGPLSKLGSEYERGMTSYYGDTESTQRTIAAQQMFAGGIAGLTMVGAGAAVFNKGPLAGNNIKNFRAGLGVMAKAAEGIPDAATGAYNYAAGVGRGAFFPAATRGPAVQRRRDINRAKRIRRVDDNFTVSTEEIGTGRGRGARKRTVKKAVTEPLDRQAQSSERSYLKGIGFGANARAGKPDINISARAKKAAQAPIVHSMKFGLGAGIALGVGASAYQTSIPVETGHEGTIESIDSTTGGIIPELQMSTQGLVLGLHRNNKSMRARYQ